MAVSDAAEKTPEESRKEKPIVRLPERVQAAIHAQEEYSEIVIGWVQLAIVVTLGTLYLVAIVVGSNLVQPHDFVKVFQTVLDGVHGPTLHLRVEGCGDF